MLLRWCLRRCIRDNVPAYLESTVDAGPLYEKHGFERVDTIALVLPSNEENDKAINYEETCFLFNPRTSLEAAESSLQLGQG